LYIINHSYPLLKKSFLSLMDANTVDISEQKLNKLIKCDTRILEYHDLHISQPSSKHNFISFHIVLDDSCLMLKECEEITSKIKNELKNYGFSHIIIQLDTDKKLKNKIHCDL
ncbi:MAG: cation transporter dimerization domain-containing protein, partial [Campylobacterota bacterium]|nr:cation transporter dimerization domain-containing protein [Campylobacterota bacterium]